MTRLTQNGIHGHVAPGFERVRDAFEANFAQGIEVGAAFCVRHGGRTLVSLWGGFQDLNATRPWAEDTLVNVYSATKGVASIAFAAVVEAGYLSYDQPVADLWPEFRAGSSGLTVAQLLSHQSGVPGVDQTLSIEDMYNWSLMTEALAKQAPYWPPGSAAGYHAVHWGYLVGELVLRASGRTLGTWLRDAVTQPLKADFYLGLGDELHPRCADLIGPNRAAGIANASLAATEVTDPPPPSPLFEVALLNPSIRPWKDACSADWRRAEIAASNGHGSAVGLAQVYDAVANSGRVGDTQILTADTIAESVIQEVGTELDLVLNKPMRRGRGFILNTEGEYGPCQQAFGHAGAGGSLGFADPDAGIGFGYVMNQMQPGVVEQSRADALVAALYSVL